MDATKIYLGTTRNGRGVYGCDMTRNANNNIFVYGMPGVGKSTKVRMLEKQLNSSGITVIRMNHHSSAKIDRIDEVFKNAVTSDDTVLDVTKDAIKLPIGKLYKEKPRELVAILTDICKLNRTESICLEQVIEEAIDEGAFPSDGLKGIEVILKDFNDKGDLKSLYQKLKGVINSIIIEDSDSLFTTQGRITELDFNGIGLCDQMDCVEFVLRILYSAGHSGLLGKGNTIVSLDEAEYADYSKKGTIPKIIMDSRKNGLGIIACTPEFEFNSRSNMKVLLKSGTKLFFKPDDMIAGKIAKTISNTEEIKLTRKLRMLDKGEYIIVGDNLKYQDGEKIRIYEYIVTNIQDKEEHKG